MPNLILEYLYTCKKDKHLCMLALNHSTYKNKTLLTPQNVQTIDAERVG